MEPIYDYFQINTKDIWPFEADKYLKSHRTDEQIYNLRNILEHLIVSTRSIQVDSNELITIQPFVTIEDYDNGTAKEYWVRHINEISVTKSQADRVRLGYFNVLDRKGIDSFFSYEQDIEIDRTNDQFDFWFALKLSQYVSGIKHIPEFLNYQLQEVFNSDISVFCEFLEEVILQYQDEFIDDKVCKKTEKWIVSQRVELIDKQDLLKTKAAPKSALQVKQYTGGYRTFLLRKAESNVRYLNSAKNEMALHELWNDLVQAGILKQQTIEKFRAIFLNVPIKKENRVDWSKSIKSLIEFVRALINSKRIVELDNVDHWLVTMDCFTLKGDDLKFSSLSKPQSEDSKLKPDIELMVQRFCSKLE
jgi:hypothetical protein